ncbi:hypothetical protein BCR33DRAFT_720849 [Rhizoclosmatium globosum]|uniref:Uncharacterized protein n=1 Tax=Rhizoclosmatium globosum TaxID=329046 RepID=A0A1Y2BU23_9FUNG|nr:hypothetical protein BCR33DRAFT_720849 [Rhizoclosmatium globosum]|eukprot:ORY38137.1 hypothetical protein BCR33DRAFT_720849 [Rhizoclosmatium globosum]
MENQLTSRNQSSASISIQEGREKPIGNFGFQDGNPQLLKIHQHQQSGLTAIEPFIKPSSLVQAKFDMNLDESKNSWSSVLSENAEIAPAENAESAQHQHDQVLMKSSEANLPEDPGSPESDSKNLHMLCRASQRSSDGFSGAVQEHEPHSAVLSSGTFGLPVDTQLKPRKADVSHIDHIESEGDIGEDARSSTSRNSQDRNSTFLFSGEERQNGSDIPNEQKVAFRKAETPNSFGLDESNTSSNASNMKDNQDVLQEPLPQPINDTSASYFSVSSNAESKPALGQHPLIHHKLLRRSSIQMDHEPKRDQTTTGTLTEKDKKEKVSEDVIDEGTDKIDNNQDAISTDSQALEKAESGVQDKTPYFESFYGFIEDPMDALHVIEGCVRGVLKPFSGSSIDMARVNIRSGTVIVVPDNSIHVRRWKDNARWSPSRAYGSFLLYREIEDIPVDNQADLSPKSLVKRSSSAANITGLEPSYSEKTLKEGTRLLKNGLTKRTIALRGSDGRKYRIVSYFNSKDILEMKGRQARSLKDNVQDVDVDGAEVLRCAKDDPQLKKLANDGTVHYGHLLADSIGYNDPVLRDERRALDEKKRQGDSVAVKRGSEDVSLEVETKRMKGIQPLPISEFQPPRQSHHIPPGPHFYPPAYHYGYSAYQHPMQQYHMPAPPPYPPYGPVPPPIPHPSYYNPHPSAYPVHSAHFYHYPPPNGYPQFAPPALSSQPHPSQHSLEIGEHPIPRPLQ